MLSQAQNIFHRMLNISYPRLRGPVSSFHKYVNGESPIRVHMCALNVVTFDKNSLHLWKFTGMSEL